VHNKPQYFIDAQFEINKEMIEKILARSDHVALRKHYGIQNPKGYPSFY